MSGYITTLSELYIGLFTPHPVTIAPPGWHETFWGLGNPFQPSFATGILGWRGRSKLYTFRPQRSKLKFWQNWGGIPIGSTYGLVTSRASQTWRFIIPSYPLSGSPPNLVVKIAIYPTNKNEEKKPPNLRLQTNCLSLEVSHSVKMVVPFGWWYICIYMPFLKRWWFIKPPLKMVVGLLGYEKTCIKISFTNLRYPDAMHDLPAISSLNWSSETWLRFREELPWQKEKWREELAYLQIKQNVCFKKKPEIWHVAPKK